MEYVIGIVIGLLLGGGGLFAWFKMTGANLLGQAKLSAEQLRADARREAEQSAREVELRAKQDQLAMREGFEREQEAARRKVEEAEARLAKREDTLDRKLDTLSHKERTLDANEAKLSQRERACADREAETQRLVEEQRQRLLSITGMTAESAKQLVLRMTEDECKLEVGEVVQRYAEQAHEEGKDKARQVILTAIQRYAADQTAEHTVSSVTIGDDAMKGRVIGREGRNIRSFEKATGVDVIIDDTPGVVCLSCFDPVRREVARLSLEKLVQDGRIHPARIEEIVTDTTKEMEELLIKVGREAAQAAQLLNVRKEALPLLGRLSYRTSYGQNVLKHSQEVAYLAQVMADELGLDGNLARRAGLLHDIGKAMDHEQEGGHPQIGADFLRKLGEPEAVLNAAAGHHGDVPATTPYTLLVMAADAISASRPGARRESLEKYVRRLRDLEGVATTFDGVRQAYAIQAGREVRVIVDAHRMDDRGSAKLARDIAKKVETDLTYPGEIKVTVLREVRSVEYAR